MYTNYVIMLVIIDNIESSNIIIELVNSMYLNNNNNCFSIIKWVTL